MDNEDVRADVNLTKLKQRYVTLRDEYARERRGATALYAFGMEAAELAIGAVIKDIDAMIAQVSRNGLRRAEAEGQGSRQRMHGTGLHLEGPREVHVCGED